MEGLAVDVFKGKGDGTEVAEGCFLKLAKE